MTGAVKERAGFSKGPRCKAHEHPRNEAYEPYAAVIIPPLAVLAGGKGCTAADGPFSGAC